MKYLLLCTLCLFAVVPVLSQHGGKAEPLRIEFAVGRSSKVLTGTLSNGEEMEYVFAGRKGQKVTIGNPNRIFEFRVLSDEFNFATEFDNTPKLSFELPETGDYNFFIRKKNVKPRRAKFTVNLKIR